MLLASWGLDAAQSSRGGTGGADRTLVAMRTRDLTDLVHFTDDGARTELLAETERLWSQVVCLQGNQGVGPMTDAGGRRPRRRALRRGRGAGGQGPRADAQWHTRSCPPARSSSLRNASDEPAVVLLVLAPPPAG